MKKRLSTMLLKTVAMQMVFAAASTLSASAANQLVSPKSVEANIVWGLNTPWPNSSELGLKTIDGEQYLTANLTVNLHASEDHHVTRGSVKSVPTPASNHFLTPIAISANEYNQHIRNKVVPNVPLVSISWIREQCTAKAMPVRNTTDVDQFDFTTNIFSITINSTETTSNLLGTIRDIPPDFDRGSLDNTTWFPVKITCYDFLYHREQTMAQVTPGYWMYDCRNKGETLGPPLFVQGVGYAYVVMEGNGEERECVTQGSVTTESLRSVVWKAEDGGSWHPDN